MPVRPTDGSDGLGIEVSGDEEGVGDGVDVGLGIPTRGCGDVREETRVTRELIALLRAGVIPVIAVLELSGAGTAKTRAEQGSDLLALGALEIVGILLRLILAELFRLVVVHRLLLEPVLMDLLLVVLRTLVVLTGLLLLVVLFRLLEIGRGLVTVAFRPLNATAELNRVVLNDTASLMRRRVLKDAAVLIILVDAGRRDLKDAAVLVVLMGLDRTVLPRLNLRVVCLCVVLVVRRRVTVLRLVVLCVVVCPLLKLLINPSFPVSVFPKKSEVSVLTEENVDVTLVRGAVVGTLVEKLALSLQDMCSGRLMQLLLDLLVMLRVGVVGVKTLNFVVRLTVDIVLGLVMVVAIVVDLLLVAIMGVGLGLNAGLLFLLQLSA